MKFAFYTLGCKVNQYETQAMEQQLVSMGHTLGSFEECCDAYIINTCTVTAVADKKNRNVIRRCRKQNPNAVVGVCGCYAQMEPEIVQELGADVVSGSAQREQFLQMMLLALESRRKEPLLQVDEALRRKEFEILPAGGLSTRTRSMLKVQDGCNNFCSYCIIPYARGPVRSLPLPVAVEQAKRLQAHGYHELVVTGIEIASWGWEWKNGSSLRQLIAAICEAAPQMRVRLGSLEPRVIDEEFCKTLSGYPNLCPQFHLSMQSGCDSVLKRMNRKYDTARYSQSVALLRQYFPGCAITTDLIVAFPGETQEEFHTTLAYLRQIGFADLHVFPYSRRPGTPADKMPNQHNNATKEARSAAAIAVADELRWAYRAAMVGTVQQVLLEQPEQEYFTGHAPNGVKVYTRGEALHNQLRSITITDVFADGVRGEISKE